MRGASQGGAPAGDASASGSESGAGRSGGGGANGPGGGGWAGGGGGRGGAGRGVSAVWVLRADGRLERVAVRVGITDGASTEIVSGDLKEGDKVVTEMASGTATAANRTTARPGGIGRMF
jgi:HlyD family secretion protein